MVEAVQQAEPLQDRERKTREILTPEGVPIHVELAPVSERAAAFILDVIFWVLTVFLLTFPFSLLKIAAVSPEIISGIVTLLYFLIRNTYFLYFELTWLGATPGKWIMGLRVIDRNGGQLLPSAVVARNLTREFEVFMPFIVLISLDGLDPWAFANWLSFSWILVIGAIPFLNRDRMRGGDLIAGTIVISLPRQPLLPDQAQDKFHFNFTDQQLLAYGNYELQVLEEVLRGTEKSARSREMLRIVGDKIRLKIGWNGEIPAEQERQFLLDFYTAERAFLEREQLFGKVKPDKHHQTSHSARS